MSKCEPSQVAGKDNPSQCVVVKNGVVVAVEAVEGTDEAIMPRRNRIWYADSSVPEFIQFWNINPASRKNILGMNALEELGNPPE